MNLCQPRNEISRIQRERVFDSCAPAIPYGEHVALFSVGLKVSGSGVEATGRRRDMHLLRQYSMRNGLKVVGEFGGGIEGGCPGQLFNDLLVFLCANPDCRAVLVARPESLSTDILDWFQLVYMGISVHVVGESQADTYHLEPELTMFPSVGRST